MHDGKIYSLEWFSVSSKNLPVLRAIDTKTKVSETHKLSEDYGLDFEPEMIDFDGDICYFCNHHGYVYKISFYKGNT